VSGPLVNITEQTPHEILDTVGPPIYREQRFTGQKPLENHGKPRTEAVLPRLSDPTSSPYTHAFCKLYYALQKQQALGEVGGILSKVK